MVGGVRGGVTGAIAAMGVIVATDVPMFLGAMIIGPFSGWVLKMFDKWTEGHIKAGFEMLVSNFSVGILGMLLAIVFIWPLLRSWNSSQLRWLPALTSSSTMVSCL